MKNLKPTLAIALAVSLVAVTSSSFAGGNKTKNKHYSNNSIAQHYDYAKVLKVKPIYREVRVSTPVRECWNEPVVHSTGGYSQHPKSAGGMAVGGILGGVIGNQVGKGRGKKLATALGAILGAGIGHNAVNGHVQSSQGHSYTKYEEQCEVHHQVSYDEVVDGYDVTYRYQGEKHHIEMPYRPGKRIKLRINITPVI